MPWSEPAGLLAIGLLAWLVSWAGTWWAIRHAQAHGLHDLPGERRSHAVPTPRGGGIGIAVAGIAALLLLAATDDTPTAWLAMAIGLSLVAGVGWWDDHRDLPAIPRLVVHVVAAALLAAGWWLHGAGPIVAVVAFLAALFLVNAWNFMDGIDGLATSQAMLCGVAFAVMLPAPEGMVGVALAAACLGFLPSNLPRARVFLGDVGSGTLGFLVAMLLAAGLSASGRAQWPVLLLPVLAMSVDVGLTLGWRMRRGERWWQAHVQHAYQRWSRRSGHGTVAFAYAIWTALACGFMLWWLGYGLPGALPALLAWVVAAVLAWRVLHREAGGRTEGIGA